MSSRRREAQAAAEELREVRKLAVDLEQKVAELERRLERARSIVGFLLLLRKHRQHLREPLSGVVRLSMWEYDELRASLVGLSLQLPLSPEPFQIFGMPVEVEPVVDRRGRWRQHKGERHERQINPPLEEGASDE